MIEAVVLYSTNDRRFLDSCIRNLLTCDIKCHIVTYTHMWNGQQESSELLEASYKEFKDNSNVSFYRLDWAEGQSPWYWEGLGRHLATQNVSKECDYILYIDVDEILDPDRFKAWQATFSYRDFDSLKLANYWYFRLPTLQATTLEDSVVLTKKELAQQIPFYPCGRDPYFTGQKRLRMVGKDSPFVHHYSWVRSKEEMLKKVANWGHASDRSNWEDLIHKEFSGDFTGRDFVHGYTFRSVPNYFNIEL